MSSAGKNHVVYKSYETISGEMNNKSKQHSTTDKKMDNTLTTSGGAPVGIKTAVVTIGPKGPVLLDDHVFINEMAHFDRERIPERVVHAKGAGAFGYFETTHDIRKYCKAVPFQCVGKKTPIAIRFSTVGGERGSADTARDPRGFAIKFYTEEGNWDLVGNNTPIFFIRDPILFPSFIHTQKKNPQTNLPDVNMFWDFITLRPETTHQVSILFSDRGTPDGYRHMHGFGSNTFKLVNEQGEAVYCKFHYKTNQGIKCLTADQATELAGSNPDYATEDLFKAIAVGDYPSWTLSIQVMTFEEAANAKWNPFDVTKVWLQSDYPLIPVGHIVLDKNPLNYFAEIEQLAFAPSMMIPGIEPSPDKMLQGRLFSYVDTQIYRLGTNYLQIPVNCPYRVRVLNYQRDGAHCINGNQGNAPNYFPNSFSGPESKPRYVHSVYNVSGDVQKYDTVDEDNFSQAGIFWRKVLNTEERKRLVQNIANHLRKAQDFIQKRAVENFAQADYEYGQMVQEELNKKPS